MFKLFKKQKKDPRELIKDLFSDAEVPSFPSAIMEVLGAVRDPSTSINHLIQKVEKDPGLSVKILRTVNSAALGLPTQVQHVGHAVNLLGRSRLETIVLSIAVKTSMPHAEKNDFDYRHFWHTSAKRACLARHIAARLHPATQLESFTGGLLMDMGVLLLLMNKKNEYISLYRQWQDSDFTLSDLEYEAFGYDHAEVGAVIAKEWQLPEHLVNAIENHHVEQDDLLVEPAIILASLLKDSDIDDGSTALIQTGINLFDLNDQELQEFMHVAFGDAAKYQELLNS